MEHVQTSGCACDECMHRLAFEQQVEKAAAQLEQILVFIERREYLHNEDEHKWVVDALDNLLEAQKASALNRTMR